MQTMDTWIVTGGVGCGKSMFCRFLAELDSGFVLFDSDECVHRLLTSPAIVRRIQEAFGSGVVDKSGEIVRPELRKLVFSDDASRKTLERIVHPAVFNELQQSVVDARANGKADCLVADVPLYFESVVPELKIDQVLVVAASRDVQVRRIVERSMGDIEPRLARQIVDAQLPVGLKISLADRAIWNDGSIESLRRQALRIVTR